MSELKLNEKVALIMGASSGMGRAIARSFSGAGARLVLAARRESELERLAKELGEGALSYSVDACDPEAVERLINFTLNAFHRIDILVYATGTNIPARSLEELTYDTWQMMLATNATGAFNCTKAVLPTMQSQKDGLILYISSICVKAPDSVSGVSYQAAKHALSGLAHGTFKEQQEYGIRTSVIFPGFCDTPLVLQRPAPTPPEVLEKALQPEDVADACLYVATAPSRARIAELELQPSRL